MLDRFLADTVLVVHLCFILFVILGWLLVIRWRWVMWPHLAAATWGALIEFGGWICPLTPLENYFRRRGGAAGFEGGFIEHYIVPLIYPGQLTRETQFAFGFAVIAVNVAAYAWILKNPRRRASTEAVAETMTPQQPETGQH